MGAVANNSSIFEATRLGLARLALDQANELTRAIECATTATAYALHVERVGVWFFSPDGSQLHCASMYEASAQRHSSGAILRAASFPRYVKALGSRRVIVAHDARSAVETSELTADYLDMHGITSLLDSPIFRHGEIVGVVCHEHVGPMREWTVRERDFAGSVADMLAVLLEQATRLDVEAALVAQRERLARAEKMDALGRFGAGLAHDFNNVLTSMMLRIDTLDSAYPRESRHAREVALLKDEAARGSRLVKQLLTFARADSYVPRPLNLEQIMRDSIPMLESLLRGRWSLRARLPAEALVVHADRAQLEQVILNLVLNARDAMPEGGEVLAELSANADTVTLVVSDRGVGIDARTLQHIFEPFFTTKAHGSGLGLSTVHSIVQQSGGTIEVASLPSHGTAFTVSLPRL
jgi:two-component system, cell cycle sensor histidine kinase and response regulator CckA